MNNPKQNPEDIVEIISNPDAPKPKSSPVKSFLIIIVCLALIGASALIALQQIKQQNPKFLTQINLPTLGALQKSIGEKIEKTPIAQFVKQPEKTPEPKPVAQLKISATQNTAETQNNKSEAQTKAEESIPSNQNPTPPAATKPNADALSGDFVLNVQGVMSSAEHGNVALINNNVYETGSVINGIKILRISLQEIVVEHNGIEETLAVKK